MKKDMNIQLLGKQEKRKAKRQFPAAWYLPSPVRTGGFFKKSFLQPLGWKIS